MSARDITKELKPQEILSCLIIQAQNGGYIDRISEWAHELYKGKYHPIEFILDDCGLTNEKLMELDFFKKVYRPNKKLTP